MRSGGPWRTVRAMSSGASDYLHPLVRTGYETPFAESLAVELSSLGDVDLIDLHQQRETTPLVGLMAESKTVEQATCLVLDLPATFDAYLATLNKSLRFDVRKLDKELFTSGRARIEEVTSDSLDRALEAFFETHRKRWRKRGLPGAFIGARTERFHRDWTQQAVANGWLWMSILHFDDNPVGVIYAMRLGASCFYYQAGFDPGASAISPGTLLVGHTIRRAINEGLTTFDFLRGDEPYKRRWKPQHEFRNLRFISPSKGVMGKMGQAWNEAGSKVEAKVRAKLEGGDLLKGKKA
jgi:CelD/BcsL family acetyltransferase involved in cellulose biosynthesis